MNNLIKMTLRLDETTNTELESYVKEKALEKASCARMLIKERLTEIREEKHRKLVKKEQKPI